MTLISVSVWDFFGPTTLGNGKSPTPCRDRGAETADGLYPQQLVQTLRDSAIPRNVDLITIALTFLQLCYQKNESGIKWDFGVKSLM